MNNPKKILLLLTAKFPFGKAETFIEPELSFLSTKFDEIVILPDLDDESTRRIPNNARIHDGFFSQYGKFTPIDLKSFIMAISSLWVWKEIYCILCSKKNKFKILQVKEILRFSVAAYKRFFWLQKLILTHQVLKGNDVWLYSYWMSAGSAALALLKRKYPSIVVFSRVHGADLYAYRNPINYHPLKEFIIIHLDAVFAISNDGKKYLEEVYKIPKNKITVSRLGITPQVNKKVTTITDTHLFHIVSCSWVRPLKRIHLIMEALTYIFLHRGAISHIPTINWTHIGSGDQEILDSIKIKADALQPLINIEFIGPLSNLEVLKYYAETPIDVFINVSIFEGLPVTIMEAMANHIPVIATDVGGTNEIVNDRNGVLLPPNPSVEAIVQAITLFFDSTLQKNKADMAYRTWRQEYNASTNFQHFADEIINLKKK